MQPLFHPFVILIQRVRKHSFLKHFCFMTSKHQALVLGKLVWSLSFFGIISVELVFIIQNSPAFNRNVNTMTLFFTISHFILKIILLAKKFCNCWKNYNIQFMTQSFQKKSFLCLCNNLFWMMKWPKNLGKYTEGHKV